MKEIIGELNASVKPILSDDQYKQHLDIATTMQNAIANKLAMKE